MPKFKHFTWDDRIRLETMLKDGKNYKEIALRLQRHLSSIYRETKRGEYMHMQTDLTFKKQYSADIAEKKYREHLAAKGADLKIGNDNELATFIENKIAEEKYSPYSALKEIENKNLKFKVKICLSTLYNYIDKNIFLKLTNKHLPVKKKPKRQYRRILRARAPKGESIEKRPSEVGDRLTFGHWEMDTVIGKRNTRRVLLVLTERFTRNEIIIPIPNGTSKSVVTALKKLKRRYGYLFKHVFKTITVDNGSEFANCEAMEQLLCADDQSSKIFYCHPYSSWERGSNENQNKLIRRWIPKSTPIEKYSNKEISNIEHWINNYPRRLFGGKTAAEKFNECLAIINDQLLRNQRRPTEAQLE